MILDMNFKTSWTVLNLKELPHETEFMHVVKKIKSIYVEELSEEMSPNDFSLWPIFAGYNNACMKYVIILQCESLSWPQKGYIMDYVWLSNSHTLLLLLLLCLIPLFTLCVAFYGYYKGSLERYWAQPTLK